MNTPTSFLRLLAAAAGLLACSAAAAAAIDYPTTLLSQAPVGYWRLNERLLPPPPAPATNNGTLGPRGNGAYLVNPILGQPGALASSSATSVRFTNPFLDPGYGGSKVEVPFDPALNPNGPFSVEFWAKPSTVVTDVFCLAASLNSDAALGVDTNSNPRAGWLFYLNGSDTNATANQWQFRLGNSSNYLDGDAIRGGLVTTGVWHHIVGTYNGSKATLYVNGAAVASRTIAGYEANQARPFRIGTSCFDGILGPQGSFAGNRGFDGWMEEVAFYGKALSAAEVAAHYNMALTNGAGYPALIQAGKPIGYWRLGEPGNPTALNQGSLGAAANGEYTYPVVPGKPGPAAPDFQGFEVTNRACAFPGTTGAVELATLNLNTNQVTITAWIQPTSLQTTNARIVFCHDGTTTAGLKFDLNDPNGLAYDWNASDAAANFKSGLAVPVLQWSFVALIVQPDQATLCLQDGTKFTTAVNYTTHPNQAFDGKTLIGADSQDPNLGFAGYIDEVAVFNRALSVGEVYSEYAAAVGNLKPAFFTDLQAPADPVYVGDTLTLSVDAGGTPPLRYQWRKDGVEIPGANTSALTRAKVTSGDAGQYDVIVSNDFGSITSQPAAIAISDVTPPQLSQTPQGRTLYQGGSLNLTAQASGGGLAYQWQRNGTNLVGATNSVLRVDQVTGNETGSYQLIVSNQAGQTQTDPVTVNVIVPEPGSYEDRIVRDAPESWWRLDEPAGSTTLVDALGRHDGAYQGGVSLGNGGALIGNTNAAAVFDGSSGYAEVPFTPALNTASFTVECWVKADAVAAALCPIASFTQPPGRGYLLQKSADGQWNYFFGDGVDPAVFYAPGSDAVYGDWAYLAVTFDGLDYTAYFDGHPEVTFEPTIVPNNVAPFRIGFDQSSDGWNDFWSGSIDEVAYYPKALTPDQIAAHYAVARYGSGLKPIFSTEPQTTQVAIGQPFAFTPQVDSDAPLTFQWSRNGLALPGETNAFLFFDSLSADQTGLYELVASNAVGSALSSAATLAVLPSPAFANVTNGLVLHLKFDQDYLDSSGLHHDARPSGSPTFVAGQIGSGAFHYSTVLDTSNPSRPVLTATNFATVDLTPDLEFSSNVNFSVSYWVRFTGSPGDLPFFGNAVNSFSNPGYTFAPSYQAGGWSWSLGDFDSTASIGIYGVDDSLNDGQWHHLAQTFDRSGSGITYLDGVKVDSRSVVAAGNLDTGDPLAIGQDPSGSYPESGAADIDDLGVWRRVLTPFEAYAIFAAGKKGTSFDTYGPVTLQATTDAGAVQVVWQAGTLLEADDPAGPWSAVTAANAPFYQVKPGAVRKFYRVEP